MEPTNYPIDLPWEDGEELDPFPSIYPLNYAVNSAEDDEVGGTSPLPFIWVYGDYGVGKSTFASMLHPARPGSRKTTLYLDFEHGNSSRAHQMAIEHIVMADVMAELFPTGYRARDLFEVWWYMMKHLPHHRYSVVVIDPISELEQGLREWVTQNPGAFGRNAGYYDRNSGAYWDDVKTLLKHILSIIAARTQTVVGVSHLRLAWEGSAPSKSGRKEPKGLKVWNELASLSIFLYRDKGKLVPSGKVDKCRLDWLDFNEVDEFGAPQVKPMLPPNMPMCTPSEIKRLMATPVSHFSADQMKDVNPGGVVLTEDERLLLQSEIAETNRVNLEEEVKREIWNEMLSLYGSRLAVQEALEQLKLSYHHEDREGFREALIRHYEKQQEVTE